MCYPQSNIKLSKSEKIRSPGNIPEWGGGGGKFKIWLENLKERDHLKELGVGGRIILYGK